MLLHNFPDNIPIHSVVDPPPFHTIECRVSLRFRAIGEEFPESGRKRIREKSAGKSGWRDMSLEGQSLSHIEGKWLYRIFHLNF